jgi:hypothetical protein
MRWRRSGAGSTLFRPRSLGYLDVLAPQSSFAFLPGFRGNVTSCGHRLFEALEPRQRDCAGTGPRSACLLGSARPISRNGLLFKKWTGHFGREDADVPVIQAQASLAWLREDARSCGAACAKGPVPQIDAGDANRAIGRNRFIAPFRTQASIDACRPARSMNGAIKRLPPTFANGRGRDEDCSSPPAQIPACAANAPGSSLGSNVGRHTVRTRMRTGAQPPIGSTW